ECGHLAHDLLARGEHLAPVCPRLRARARGIDPVVDAAGLGAPSGAVLLRDRPGRLPLEEPVKIAGGGIAPMAHPTLAFIGVPYDGDLNRLFAGKRSEE